MCTACSDLTEKSSLSADRPTGQTVKTGNVRRSHLSLQSALVAGAVATAAMTVFTFLAPLMGFEMNIPKMLANKIGAPIVIGWIVHFMIGEILAINFGGIFLSKTNENADIKSGALFGLIPWFVTQVVVMPMMSILSGGSYLAGFFSGSIVIAMASLVGHLLYGAILGSIYKPKIILANAIV